MSTLTKILIVLLTISSIFLCGIVVTYVGSATNYKKQFEDRKKDIDSLKEDKKALTNDLNGLIEKREQDSAAQSSKIQSYVDEIDTLNSQLKSATSKISDYEQRWANYGAIFTDHVNTLEAYNQRVNAAENERDELQKQKIENEKSIKELELALLESDTKLDQLEIQKKQLEEENTQLQNQLDQRLQMAGMTTIKPVQVTTKTNDPATMTPPVRNINIEGRISEINQADSLVSINIGSADGVTEGMIFHVVRGSQFICDIGIFEVDADQAAGFIDRAGEGQPKVNDIVKTNF